MTTLSMQTVVNGKTVQIVLLEVEATAKIYVVDSDGSSHRPRTMSVQEYVDSGMSSEEVVRHILEVVTASLEHLDDMRKR